MRDFYERHHLAKPIGEASRPVPQMVQSLRTRGSRYFCVFDYLSHPEKLSALELGFGYPEISNALAGVFGSYLALDVAADAIASRHGHAMKFDYRAADLNQDFPVTTASVDVVIAMMVIEHLFDPFHSFREVARVCRPGGSVFVNLPLITSIKSRLALLFGAMPTTSRSDWFEQREWDGGHLHYFDIAHVRRLGALNGLDLTRTYPVGRAFALKRMMPGLLCGELSFVFTKKG